MALSEIIPAFIWGPGGSRLTPEQIASRRAIEDALLAQGLDFSPVQHPLQGAARVANAAAGAFRRHRLDKADAASAERSQAAGSKLMAALFGGGANDTFPAAPGAPGGAGGGYAPPPTTPPTVPTGSSPDVARMEAYIRDAAVKRGIDPDVAVRVARSEGLAPGVWQSNVRKNGRRETSYGPFQLLVGGGLGDKFQKIYGKSPADPSTAYSQIDFALDEAARGGWGPWYGAAKVGVGRRTGLERARPLGVAAAPAAAPPVHVASLDPSIGMGGAAAAPAMGLSGPALPANPPIPQPAPVRTAGIQIGDPPPNMPIPERFGYAPGEQPFDLANPTPIQGVDVTPPEPAPAPVHVAQAMPERNPMSGNVDVPPVAPDVGQLLGETMFDPYLSPDVRKLAEALFQQQMRQRDPAYQLDMEYRRAQLAKMQQEMAGGGPVELGLTPQYGVDENGNPVLIQIGKDGRAIRTQLPEGVTLSKEPIKIDAGTHFVLLDPITRQPVGQIPKENYRAAYDTASGTEDAKAAAEKRSDLPKVEQQAKLMLSTIDSLLSHPGFSSAVGWQGNIPDFMIPAGTETADFMSLLDQINGQAFLQAFESLKGAGQITEIEGQKATQAISRLKRGLSEEEFKKAALELRSIIQTGLERARKAAGASAGDGGSSMRDKYGLD